MILESYVEFSKKLDVSAPMQKKRGDAMQLSRRAREHYSDFVYFTDKLLRMNLLFNLPK